jgi:undecaprenyl-diphosphatase
MDFYLLWSAFLLGIIEGVTEFLPVSSTGHLIIGAELLGFIHPSSKVFEIFIQLGAILAVVVEYRKKIVDTFIGVQTDKTAQVFTKNLIIAFIPAAILGFFFHSLIKLYLFNPIVVGIALVVGGILMIFIEKKLPNRPIVDVDKISNKQALIIGIAQCFSLIPGVSRAASTIMGGLIGGLDRKTATEFSFFLAIPIIFAASVFDLSSNIDILSKSDIPVFVIGFITAFFSSYLIIKIFIWFVAHNTFVVFGWYRIIVGFLTIYYFL